MFEERGCLSRNGDANTLRPKQSSLNFMNPEPPKIPVPPPALPPIANRKRGLPLLVKITIVLAVAFVGFLGFRMVQFVRYARSHPRQAVPGEAEFREANRQIIANQGSVGFGNNREAVALAQEYSRSLKIMRDNFFSEGKKGALSMSKGEFLTYCQWNGDSCVFLVHVPELRRFTSEAKQSLSELAWINAQAVLTTKTRPPPKTVVVGVKGALLYESILVGNFIAEPTPGVDGIKTRGSGVSDTAIFHPFFAPKDAPAKSAEK